MNLWRTNACDAWQAALDQYADTVRAQQVNGLAEIDAWYREELPARIAARRPAYVTLAELERFTVWKMKRGVWRECNRLLEVTLRLGGRRERGGSLARDDEVLPRLVADLQRVGRIRCGLVGAEVVRGDHGRGGQDLPLRRRHHFLGAHGTEIVSQRARNPSVGNGKPLGVAADLRGARTKRTTYPPAQTTPAKARERSCPHSCETSTVHEVPRQEVSTKP